MSILRGPIAAAAACLALLSACDSEQAAQNGSAAPSGSAASNAGAPASSNPTATGDRQALLARGKYLVETIAGCGNCHTPHNQDGTLNFAMSYAGAFVIEEPEFRAYAPNITPDMETGIGSWSEDDIVNALRNAVRPDGTFLGPPMSFAWYRRLSDTDARAIAAFMKSVPAIRNEVPRGEYHIPLNGYGPTVTSVPDVPRDDPVRYGEYLAGPVGHCMDCHTPLVMGQNDMAQLGRGQNVFRNIFGGPWTAIAANITPHPEQGLGRWTDAEIKRAITQGISRDGRQLLPAMPFQLYANIEERDLDAIVAYLRSIPPLTTVAPPQ